MKKRILAPNPTSIARLIAKLDGRGGLTVAEAQDAIQKVKLVEKAIILDGKIRSLTAVIRAQAKREAIAFKKAKK